MRKILNYINGEWIEPKDKGYFDVINPATGELIAKTPLCGFDAVDSVAKAAAAAFPDWRRTPVQDRIQFLFKLRDLLKGNADEIARTITNEAGNIGINIGVAEPMAFFPFSGWKDSFFGDIHGQGMDAVEFFTQKKVVVERWPKEWSRKF